MKKDLATAGKAIGFLAAWLMALIVYFVSANKLSAFISDNDALLRLWLELLPLLGVLLITVFFVLVIDKNKIKIPLLKNPLKNGALGFVLGCIWIGGPILSLYLAWNFQLGSKNEVSNLAIWCLAILLNAIMQEYLVRGYLFSLLKENFNIAAAVIFTTAIFTAMHGGSFEAGIIPFLNVITTGVFISLLLVYTESLLAPIIVHFIWNGVGHLVFGVVPLAEDYPSIWNGVLTGNTLLTGGSAKLDGSIVVLIINIILIAFIALLVKWRESQDH